MNPFNIVLEVLAIVIVLIAFIKLFKRKKGAHTKKGMKTMDIILIIVGSFLLLFTISMIVIFCYVGAVPDALVTCVFGACAGECGIMGWIKTTKDKHENRKWELEDRKAMKWGEKN